VGVAVDHEVDAGELRQHVRAAVSVGSRLIVHAEVPQTDHDVSAVLFQRVDLRLRTVVQRGGAGGIAEERNALDQAGVDLGLGLRGLKAEEADLHAALGLIDIGRVKDALAVLEHVRANDLEVCLAEVVHQLGIAVVKLVVAERDDVIARGVHHLDGARALGYADVGVTLAEVARVGEDDLGAALDKLRLEGGDVGVAVDLAVYVVGVQDHGLAREVCRDVGERLGLGGHLVGGPCADTHQAEYHDQCQQQGQILANVLHAVSSLCNLEFALPTILVIFVAKSSLQKLEAENRQLAENIKKERRAFAYRFPVLMKYAPHMSLMV